MLTKSFQNIEDYVSKHDTISMHDIFDIVGRDSLLILLILMSIFNIILSPLPANSFVLGVPLLVLSAAYAFNLRLENITWKIFYKKLNCSGWNKYLKKGHGIIQKIDEWTDPRFEAVFLFESRLTTGFALLFMNLVVFLPIPFMNIPGSFGTIFMAIGLMERDGAMMAAGYLCVLAHILIFMLFNNMFL